MREVESEEVHAKGIQEISWRMSQLQGVREEARRSEFQNSKDEPSLAIA